VGCSSDLKLKAPVNFLRAKSDWRVSTLPSFSQNTSDFNFDMASLFKRLNNCASRVHNPRACLILYKKNGVLRQTLGKCQRRIPNRIKELFSFIGSEKEIPAISRIADSISGHIVRKIFRGLFN